MQKPRQLSSGKWQARYNFDGKRVSGGTYDTEKLARAGAVTELARAMAKAMQPVVEPTREMGVQIFRDYAESVIAERLKDGEIGVRTAENYSSHLRRLIYPAIGDMRLRDIRKADVRHFWNSLPATPNRLNAYRVMTGILARAVDDDELEVNVSLRAVRGAGKSLSKAREYLTMEDFWRLHDACSRDMQAVLLTILGGSLRIGEALGLDRRHVNLQTGVVKVEQQLTWKAGGSYVSTTLKGKESRTTTLPEEALEALRDYVKRHPVIGNAPLFMNASGQRLSRSALYRDWYLARIETGLPEAHIHDLRHTSLTMAAQSGATLAEVMQRAGHKDSRSAMIYQHAALERDAAIASKMSDSMKRSATA